ncbi:MAG: alkaline phosphatase family protein [Actinomycetota bacterium]|nr:alkaline phosphatase family protein [Actinomycetota bacterium]
MHVRRKAVAVSALAAIAIGIPVAAGSADASSAGSGSDRVSHVLLISVDGLHQSDLAWYVATHPSSELAKLVGGGRQYTNAHAPVPTDSDPGMTAQMTGGDPRTTGVYYDVEYNHALLPPGTPSCTPGMKLGANVIYDSPDDKDVTRLDAGQGLSGLPGSILQMTSKPQTLLVPSTFPVDPKTCQPIPPHAYLEVNTIFNVIHDHGLRTAWSDKHPVYESFNGPSGNGIDDLFAPEIDSTALQPNGTPYPGNIAWTGDNAATMQYDSYKVQAVINEIDGYNHSGTEKLGVPAIMGMNFQTVSTAEKLPVSDGLNGGYLPGTKIPGPLLRRALGYINSSLERMVREIHKQGLASSTAIIISAKHGQSPQNPLALTRISDGPIIDHINDAWAKLHPGGPALVAAASDDDAMLMWLSNRSVEATSFVKGFLLGHNATGTTYNVSHPELAGPPRTLEHSGLAQVFAGIDAARFFGVDPSDPRHPDVLGVVQRGVVYTGGLGKIAEHGGSGAEDRDVALVIYAPSVVHAGLVSESVQTRQIAPTILQLLGLNPQDLKAVQIEGTKVLPGA